MATTTAISSQTAAATAGADITIAGGASVQVWTTPTLAAGEAVQLWRTDGASVVERVREGSQPIELGSGRHSVSINGPITLRLIKTVTATATAVLYDS